MNQIIVAMTTMILFHGYIVGHAKTEFDYPELLVSPSASETLKRQSRSEANQRWSVHAHTQVSAVLNLVTGLRAMGEGAADGESAEDAQSIKDAGLLASSIGAGWIGLTLGMSAFYSPYRMDF